MGWLFGHYTRASLVEHLTNGDGVKTLKRCFRGNNMWAVHEHTDNNGVIHRWACLYLIKGNPRVQNDHCNWGYKDVDETMGPYKTDFPLSWLELLTPTDSEHALKWREAVRERGLRMKECVVGSEWCSGEKRYTVIRRRSPSSLVVRDEWGDLYRISPARLSTYDQVTK